MSYFVTDYALGPAYQAIFKPGDPTVDRIVLDAVLADQLLSRTGQIKEATVIDFSLTLVYTWGNTQTIRTFDNINYSVDWNNGETDVVQGLFSMAMSAGFFLFQSLEQPLSSYYEYQYSGANGAVVEGSNQIDVIEVDGLKAVIKAGGGDDAILSTGQCVRVYAGHGEDYVTGSFYGDLLRGQKGDDTLIARDGNDRVFGGAGEDRIDGGRGADVLDGGNDDDTIHAGLGDDVVYGGRGNDLLYTTNGTNTVFGGVGHDVIISSGLNNKLTGGAGRDAFIFVVPEHYDASVVEDDQSTGVHIIKDFDVEKDMLALAISDNTTYTSWTTWTALMSHPEQVGENTVLRLQKLKVVLRDVDLDSLSYDSIRNNHHSDFEDWPYL